MSAGALAGTGAVPAASVRPNWRRAASHGVLWGIAVQAMESFALPLGDIRATELLLLEAHLMAQWCIAGVVLSSATMLLERQLSPVPTGTVLVAFTFALWVCASWWIMTASPYLPPWLNDHSYVHVLWSALFYVGLFIAGHRLGLLSERTRALLAQAEIARQQTEALLSTAQLETLQGHVDPAFLLRVMVEVERRYARDAVGVERLLDALVGFLRAAMPGLRSAASTLAAELRLAGHYAQVWHELDAGRATWNLRVAGALPDVPFPALLLLPVLDQLAALDDAAPPCELELTQAGGRCTLTLARSAPCRARWLAPELVYRLQVGLRALFGDAWTLAVHDAARPALVLTLPVERPLQAAPPRQANRAYPFATDEETSHG